MELPKFVPCNNNLLTRGHFIGSGSFSKCYILSNFDDESNVNGFCYAGKFIKTDSLSRKGYAQKEIDILSSITHENIINLHNAEYFENITVLVLDLCKRYNLDDKINIRPYNIYEAKNTFLQLCEAVKYLHSKDIIHRDIKLDNILFSEDNVVKLCDFGLSDTLPITSDKRVGTPYYLSPEILFCCCEEHISDGISKDDLFFNKDCIPKYGPHSDIWSVGVSLFYSLCGVFPYESVNGDIDDLGDKIYNLDYTFPKIFNDKMKRIINEIFILEYENRITLDHIVELLKTI